MRNFPRVLLPTLIAPLFLLIAAFGIAKALSQFQKSIHSDVAYHNLAAVSSKTTGEFFSNVGLSTQPVLESAMRRLFFVPVLGDNERTIRIPDLLCWVLILLFVPILTLRALQTGSAKTSPLLFISILLVMMWAAENRFLVKYSVFGRHYEWCALISLLWFSFYNQADYFKSKWFHVLSLVYLNSHFFVWPLVGSAYLYHTIRLLKEEKTSKELFFCFAFPAAIFLGSAVLNWEGIYVLVIKGAYNGSAATLAMTDRVWNGVLSGLSLVRLFRSVFDIKYAFILIALLGAGYIKRNTKFFLSAGVFLLSLIIIRSSASFPFSPRYMLPFFGLAWLFVVEVVLTILYLIELFDRKIPLRTLHGWGRVAFFSGSASFFVWFYGVSPKETTLSALQAGWPKENFTDEFFEYEKIKSLSESSIVIGGGGWPYLLTLWYLRDQTKENPKIRGLSQDMLDAVTWKKSWVEFKQKNPSGKTFVHFYNPGQCDNADPTVFHELKRFSEGCIGEVIAAESVEKLELFFSKSRGAA